MLHQCEEEVRRILSDNKDGRSKLDPMESGVVAVYKSKLEEYAKLNVELEKQVDQLQVCYLM